MAKSPSAVANQHSLGIDSSAKDGKAVNSSTQPSAMLQNFATMAVLHDSCKKPISIIPTAKFVRNEKNGSDLAILRSLRAAGVKFMRYTIVDAYNNIRCKAVPISHALSMIPNRTQKMGKSTSSSMSPLDNPVSIAEVCFAGLPSYADELISTSKLDAQNVLILQPDLSTLRVLPYAPQTAMIMCTAHNQQTKELSPLCTRGLLERVIYVAREELGVEFCVGAELEFMLYRVDNKCVPKPVDFSMFANSLTLNEQEEFIGVLFEQLQQQDISVDMIHAESAPSQLEVVLTYSSNPIQLADDVMLAKETISACAKTFGMKALFLPKTSMCHAGNGLHLHFSFRDRNSKSNENAFSDHTRQHGISAIGASFIEGILQHLPSLLSFSLPTVNSFRRMGPGCWTGHKAEWAIEHKEVPLRVCLDLNTGLATHVEFKLSDACANIYLQLAMILSAGMEGMKSERTLRPKSGDAGGSNYETNAASEILPRSLQQSLYLLKDDEFLISVMGPAMSTAYIAVREAEISQNKTLEEEVAEAFRKA